MRRALAAVAAAAIVIVAVVVRSAIDDGGSADRGDHHVVVVCATELADACHALPGIEVRVEDAARTAERLEAGTLADDVDGWFTTSPWVEIERGRDPRALGELAVVARTEVAVVADAARVDAISTLCNLQRIWRCLGDHAGSAWEGLGGDRRWGSLKTGLPDADTAVGLGVLESIAAGYFGNLDFASNDFTDAAFASWLGGLIGPSGGTDPDTLATLTTRRGTYSVVGTTTSRVRSIGQPTSPLDLTPAVSIEAVLVSFPHHDRLPGADPARAALVATGWDGAEGDAVPTLLKPGVLAALHSLWSEVTR